jgi:hypothetical protein
LTFDENFHELRFRSLLTSFFLFRSGKSFAYYSTLKAGVFEDKGGNIPISLLFMTPDKRKRDADNMLAASKSLLDGVAQALKVDDSRFKPILVDWVHGEPKVGALVVAVGVQIVSGVAL